MSNTIYDYFNTMNKSNKINQSFLIGNVSFDDIQNDLNIILRDFFFKKDINIYENPDIYILRQNERIITKSDIKKLLSDLSLTSQFNNIKVYIIEDCEKLSDSVYNSLLKTLEEPEKGIYAFLLTRNISAVRPTISSRCQKFFVSSNSEIIINENYNDIAMEIVKNIEKNGHQSLALNNEIYNKIKDRNEFNSVLYNMINIYRNILLKILNNNLSDNDLDIVSKNNIKKILEKILVINKTMNLTEKNLNKNICIDRFIIEMWRCKG